MFKQLIIAAATLVAANVAASAAEGKTKDRLHCTYGPITVDVDENDNITSNLPTDSGRPISVKRSESGETMAEVRIEGARYNGPADTASCATEYTHGGVEPYIQCEAGHWMDSDANSPFRDYIFLYHGTVQTSAMRPRPGEGFSYSMPDSKQAAMLLSDDGVVLIRDGSQAMLITPRGRATCFAEGMIGGVRGTFNRSDADLIAEARRNADLNQEAMKRFAGAVCRFSNGTVLDHGVLYSEGHANVQATVSVTPTGYAISAQYGVLYAEVSASGAAAFGTYEETARKDGKPVDPNAWVPTSDLAKRRAPIKGSCTGLPAPEETHGR